jgi:hypothetical protein
MKELLVTMAVIGVMSTPVLADPMSEHRAATIENCSHDADTRYGPSGGHDWRRYDHDYYASCMGERGEPE